MNSLLFRLILVCVCSAVISMANAQVPESERQALIDFYHATNGEHWHDDEGWLGEEGSECEWLGVACNTTNDPIRHVRVLSLPANRLTGSLPDSLPQLTELAFIRLGGNAIEGPIPAILGTLEKLNTLDLSGNRLSGPIPGELLATPAHRIGLAGNQLDGYTEATGTTSSDPLSVDLSRNPISTLPPKSWRTAGTISRLQLERTALKGELDFEYHPWPRLGDLNLADNAITALRGIDETTLSGLRWLHLNGNDLAEHWPVSGQTLSGLTVLDLTDNRLSTAPPAGFSLHPNLTELRLGHNNLEGEMIRELFLLPNLQHLELQHNPLNNLPSEIPSVAAPQTRLDLSHAGLEGDPPAWFSDLSLATLNLSGNRLSGSPVTWLAALRTGPRVRLDLSNNHFYGPLPTELGNFDYFRDSLDVCWNDFEEPFGNALDDLLESAHFGGHPADCNGRQLVSIDPTISGSWYKPERDGKGYSVMLLETGQLLYYWFGYPSMRGMDPYHQKWTFQMVRPDGAVADYPPSLAPHGGRFDSGLGRGRMQDYEERQLRMVRLEGDGLSVVSRLLPGSPNLIIDPPPPPIHERIEYTRLTELAGTTCDNQSDYQHLSGLWYNPEREGEGFLVEILPDDRALVYWFTYRPDTSGVQAWVIGDGPLKSYIIGTPPPTFPVHAADVTHMIQPAGTVSGPGFDSSDIEHVAWGKLRLEFHQRGTAHVHWESQLNDYGSGDYSLERLARPMLAECE